jgi:actin-related protein
MNADDQTTIVIDIGSIRTKSGFSGQHYPNYTINT